MADLLSPVFINGHIFTTGLLMDGCIDTVYNYFKSNAAKNIYESRDEDGKKIITAEFGSKSKVKFLGTLLAGMSAWPLKVQVELEHPKNADYTKVCVSVNDTFGDSMRIGLRDSIKKAMTQHADSIEDALSTT